MNLSRAWIIMATVACSGLFGILALNQTDTSNAGRPNEDRARTVVSQALPVLQGDHVKAALLEIRYGRGEASPSIVAHARSAAMWPKDQYERKCEVNRR